MSLYYYKQKRNLKIRSTSEKKSNNYSITALLFNEKKKAQPNLEKNHMSQGFFFWQKKIKPSSLRHITPTSMSFLPMVPVPKQQTKRVVPGGGVFGRYNLTRINHV